MKNQWDGITSLKSSENRMFSLEDELIAWDATSDEALFELEKRLDIDHPTAEKEGE